MYVLFYPICLIQKGLGNTGSDVVLILVEPAEAGRDSCVNPLETTLDAREIELKDGEIVSIYPDFG
jgi:hypothetical protein